MDNLEDTAITLDALIAYQPRQSERSEDTQSIRRGKVLRFHGDSVLVATRGLGEGELTEYVDLPQILWILHSV